MSITVWFSSATKSDLRRLRRVVRTADRNIGTTLPALQELYLSSEQKGWQNHSGPLTSSTLPLWTVTIWPTLQSSEHQNDQTQKQFLSPSNPSHEHLTLNVEHTSSLLYNYLFTTYTFSFQICTSDLYTQLSVLYFVYLLFCTVPIFHICILFCCCLCPCPIAVILLNCGASVTITEFL